MKWRLSVADRPGSPGLPGSKFLIFVHCSSEISCCRTALFLHKRTRRFLREPSQRQKLPDQAPIGKVECQHDLIIRYAWVENVVARADSSMLKRAGWLVESLHENEERSILTARTVPAGGTDKADYGYRQSPTICRRR